MKRSKFWNLYMLRLTVWSRETIGWLLVAIAPQNDLFETMGRGNRRMVFLSLILNLTGGAKEVNILKY